MHISNGQHGKALQNYLKHLKYDTPETKNKFEAIIDRDGHNGIDEKEAKVALQRLDMFNRVDVTLLTETEVENIISSFRKPVEAESPLKALGTVYRVGKYDVVMLKKENIEIYLGVTLNTLFENAYPALKDKSYDVKKGYIFNTNWRQDVALLDAINSKYPKLNVRMLNLSAAQDVFPKLKEQGVIRDLDIWWFRTGSVFNENLPYDQQTFDDPGLISADDLRNLDEKSRMFYMSIDEDKFGWDFPGSLLYQGAVIFAIERKN